MAEEAIAMERSTGALASPTPERARWPWFVFAAFVGTFVPGLVFHFLNGQEVVTTIPFALAFTMFSLVGLLVVTRDRHNRVGLLLLVGSLIMVACSSAGDFATWALSRGYEGPVVAIPALTPRITSNADHYTVDTTLIKPSVELGKWSLEVGGAVESPFSLSYDELLDLEAVEQLKTLECISNEVGGDLISTALWTGVPLRDLLARAQPKPATYDVKLTSVDGYTDSIRIEKAMEPDTIVAYLMNGVTIPQDHGYPARLLVPNIYGMKNVKWLKSIECVTFDYLGYWMERGWSDLAVVNTNTRIDTPSRAVKWDGTSKVLIAGIAFAGARGIAKVEGVARTESLIAFQVYSTHDLERLFSIGFEEN